MALSESLLDTIVALATPVGRSAVALIRLSGEGTRAILSIVVRGAPSPLEPRRASLVSFVDPKGETIDRGLLIFFPGPSSYTGEDVAELSIHGSPVAAGVLLESLRRAGARPARPGEFTERAFLSGKIDLVRAEAVRDVIEARTETAARLSARRLEGRLSGRLAEVREELLTAAAQLAATIDFAEDVGESVSRETIERLRSAEGDLASLVASYETGRLLTEGCRVVLVGPPNAGKSTLFNALLGGARAIVTDIPGTTRDVLEGGLDVGGIPVTLVDTAGLRESADPIERIGVARAREQAELADAVVYVADASRGWNGGDAAAVAACGDRPIVLVANKSDLGGPEPGDFPPEAARLCGTAPDAGPLLRSLLERALAPAIPTEETSEVLGSLRQRDLLERARAATDDAARSLEAGESPEYGASRLDAALSALADVLGETTPEEILARIFSSFCIGK